jgi:hypothetical protein
MIPNRSSAWLGPLSRAPAEVTSRLRDEPGMTVLLGRGWTAERTLLYVPPRREGYDLHVVVVGRNVNIGENKPILWMFSTVGLSAVQQARRGAAQAFRRIELVLVLSNSEREDPFPTRLGVALAQEPNPFPGWDWSQVEIPPLVDWLSVAGEELGAAIKSSSTFAVQDTLTLGPGNSTWTRSRLSHSALLPSNPHMQSAGFAPFDSTASRDGIDPTNWNKDPATERYSCGFYWLLPVTHPEYDAANAGGTWNMFADLVEKSHELGGDDFALSYDLLR